jgi:FlaA1/EpsC-like NDP-sugar epimerase
MLKDKRVLITGGTGSLGNALVRRLLSEGARVTVFSRDEKKQYDMKKVFPDIEYVIGDVKNYHSIRDAVRDKDIVIHAASLKYVNIGELQPNEYAMSNVVGTINTVNAVLEERTIEHCVGISTDKACMPVNAYGLTKALLEKIMLEANSRQGEKGSTVFNVARYGNVIGTNGSVVPFWKERRDKGLSLPVTNPDMTRFFFTLDEAVDLIFYCLSIESGLIVSKAMKSVTLGELAEAMKGSSEVELVGERPGEKYDEMLLSPEEMSKSIKNGLYFVYNPNAQNIPVKDFPEGYGSSNCERLTESELTGMLKEWL